MESITQQTFGHTVKARPLTTVDQVVVSHGPAMVRVVDRVAMEVAAHVRQPGSLPLFTQRGRLVSSLQTRNGAGLVASGVNMLNSIKASGLNVNVINIMAMDSDWQTIMEVRSEKQNPGLGNCRLFRSSELLRCGSQGSNEKSLFFAPGGATERQRLTWR